MDSAPESVGIWKHWKTIIRVLTFFFIVSVGADIALWYSLHNNNSATETLNQIIANQPPAPKTDVDKTNLLDTLAAVHTAAMAQAGSPQTTAKTKSTASTSVSTTKTGASASAIDAKIKLLDALRKTK